MTFMEDQAWEARQARRDEIIEGRLPYTHVDAIEQRDLRIADEDDRDALADRAMDWADGLD